MSLWSGFIGEVFYISTFFGYFIGCVVVNVVL